jgi:outer membrane protein OmpA-like peptidoglycan-associated protein
MDSTQRSQNPARDEAAGAARHSGRGKLFYLFAALVAVGVVLAFLIFSSLNRMNRQVAQLTHETQRLEGRLSEVERESQNAAKQASEAAESAQAAAAQRDQAEQARAASENAAETARQQTQTAQQRAAAAEQKAEEYRKQRQAELARLQRVLGQITETRRTAMGLIMTLGSESVRFDFDKSEIKPRYRETLSRIAGVLSTLKGYSIYVYGYTDDIGTQEYNLKLSERRAEAVRDYLVKAGLDPEIISTKGFGKADPRVRGDSPEVRAKNRRVEIGIVDSTLHVAGQVLPPH